MYMCVFVCSLYHTVLFVDGKCIKTACEALSDFPAHLFLSKASVTSDFYS